MLPIRLPLFGQEAPESPACRTTVNNPPGYTGHQCHTDRRFIRAEGGWAI
jgi:hypothetical protein